MAHAEQLNFVSAVKAAFPEFFTSARTIEIGSLDIRGTVRGFFDGGSYVGLDVAAGSGVDVVCQGQDYNGPSGSFDTVISCEVMEHNPYWAETLSNMVRLCRPGGLLVMTCASTVRAEHGTTRSSPGDSPLTIDLGWDYYRNLTERDFRKGVPLLDAVKPLAFFTNWRARDLYMIGFKRGVPPPSDTNEHIAEMSRHYRRANLRYGVGSNYFLLRFLVTVIGEGRYHALRASLPGIGQNHALRKSG